MWEKLTVYRPLDKKLVNQAFKDFGRELAKLLPDYTIEQTSSVIKVYRFRNRLEQSIFIEKSKGGVDLQVRVCIKPEIFFKKHKFTMINIVPLGEILGMYRRSFYPLTEEWIDLAIYLSKRIQNEVERYFAKFDTYEKIIRQRKDIEPKNIDFENKYELLIYAAFKTFNIDSLMKYLDKKRESTAMQITHTEFLKSEENEIDQEVFFSKIKVLALEKKFKEIEELLDS